MYTPQQRFVSGVSSELFVAHKLTELGYEVFLPVMTQSKVDFLVMKDSRVLKVQVKKASWSTTHDFQYLQARIHGMWVSVKYSLRKLFVLKIVGQDP